ncbi:MAG: DUF1223 domain-containing protein [Gammaproteobacteria bacterium]|nr:DUF1223 domain-containing protein [Gammaproteobacteria bacterium]
MFRILYRPHIVPLIELYTSEGCSSCPPADQWMSGLADQGFTSDKVIPLAFHVDYWDYIGWKDRFASPKFTDRQRQVVAAGRTRFAYTPQVLFNGIDFGDWRNRANFADAVLASQKQQSHTKLSLTLSRQSSGELLVVSTEQINADASNNAEVYFAVYENNLISSVNAGENSGRNLSHNRVVRELYGPYPPDQHSFTLGVQWRQRNAGIVSFVQDRETGQVLQALDRLICITQ